MSILDSMLKDVKTVAIIGHIHPDGDCVGSCLGTYNYLAQQYPEIQASVFLEAPSPKFSYLKSYDLISSDSSVDKVFDLCICLDSSDKERLGEFVKYLDSAKNSLCMDHHITNTGYAKENIVITDSSSTSEVVYRQMDEEQISKEVAECIYTGIIHDTGVFKYGCTSPETMKIAGNLMSKGIDFSSIIDDSFYRKTYIQNQILGRALLESMTVLDGRCIFSVARQKDLEFYNATNKDLDGIIDQLRITEGVDCAIFMYEVGNHEYKVSIRSNNQALNVSKIASYFGGGGHVMAAGCTMSGSIHDVINNLTSHIEKQLA